MISDSSVDNLHNSHVAITEPRTKSTLAHFFKKRFLHNSLDKQYYCQETRIWQPVSISFHAACYQFDNQKKISTTIPQIIKVTFASQTTQMLKGSQRTHTEPNSVVNTPLWNCNAKWKTVQCMCLPYLSVFPRRLRSPVLKVAMLNSHCTCKNITTWMRKTFKMFRTRLLEAFGSQY